MVNMLARSGAGESARLMQLRTDPTGGLVSRFPHGDAHPAYYYRCLPHVPLPTITCRALCGKMSSRPLTKNYLRHPTSAQKVAFLRCDEIKDYKFAHKILAARLDRSRRTAKIELMTSNENRFCGHCPHRYRSRTPGLPTCENKNSIPASENVFRRISIVSSGIGGESLYSSNLRMTAEEIPVRWASCFTDQFNIPRAPRICAPVSLNEPSGRVESFSWCTSMVIPTHSRMLRSGFVMGTAMHRNHR